MPLSAIFHSKRQAMKSTATARNTNKARTARRVISAPNVGPTASMEVSARLTPATSATASTRACSSSGSSAPVCTRTTSPSPSNWMRAPSNPSGERAARTSSTRASAGFSTWTATPPKKSTPRFRLRNASESKATNRRNADSANQRRRRPTKSMSVSLR